MEHVPINGEVYREAEELRTRIDRLAERLTGDLTYFWTPGHGTRGVTSNRLK